ncbi:MAG: response regulator, partial [Chloroflexota bacterium]
QAHTAIAQELGISIRQASRVHLDALGALARVLFPDRFRPAPSDGAAKESLPSASPHPAATRMNQSLEAELASVGPGAAEIGVDLGEVTIGVRETFGRFAAAHGVTVELDLPGSLPPVRVNRVALRQIQLNLLIYLVDLVRRRSDRSRIVVSIRGELANGGVALTAWWDGEVLEVGDRSPCDSSGRALLDAASYLTRLQGARIEEVGDGRAGLGIALWLPISDVRAILVVDDNPDVGKLFARMLAKHAYHVVQARSAGRALSVARESPPEAILLDVVMPSRDGWELLATLKGDPKLAEIPVIVCSVLPDRELALSLGAADFLPKPVTRSTLLRALERVFVYDAAS